MANIDFYSVYDRKMIKVPEEDVELVTKGKREMLVGNIMVDGQHKKVYKIKPKAMVWKKYSTSKKGGQHYKVNK
jgi:hypothetical protein